MFLTTEFIFVTTVYRTKEKKKKIFYLVTSINLSRETWTKIKLKKDCIQQISLNSGLLFYNQ